MDPIDVRSASVELPAAPGEGGAAEARSVLDGFHPAVRRWFEDRFEGATPIQRRGWPPIRGGHHTLLSAPTGSGKTLAAFLDALDRLYRAGCARGGLPDECRVVYVSPLKALSADIHRNLATPRKGIRRAAAALEAPRVRITAAVRTGDTPRWERRSMVETPPHILVTTPESLYLLLTARKSRAFLESVETVIVDEIHAVLESRRGAHLALTLERLDDVTAGRLQRIGLSATQHPIEEVGRFLVGTTRVAGDGVPACEIVDEGHERELDLDVEVPGSPLEAVLSGEAREEIHDRLAALIAGHHTTLVFVNTRREAERVAGALAERLGEATVTAHHGSLSKETRLRAERRLKEGELRGLVATASLELGIDVGHVDLVCQLGTPNRIATFVQRVGRSGHTVEGTPRGRLFPLTRDDLVQAAALLRAVRRGELDRIRIRDAPLDILAQHMVAEVACGAREEDELFRLVRGGWPYRDLSRETFDEIARMLGRGIATGRGRRGRRLHRDAVNGVLKPRKGSRLAALTSGGAIPDNADYRVVREPDGTFLGTVNEDFAIESLPGDVFQLGNTSWRLLRVETGVVRVEDARGEPPNIPFWFGEAPARSEELSRAVAEIRREAGRRLAEGAAGSQDDVSLPADSGGQAEVRPTTDPGSEGEMRPAADPGREAALEWVLAETGVSRAAAFQLVEYLAESRRALGALPTDDSLVLERFFDESGGMQLVLHAPLGSRVNRAWGLALRKRFCRQFNFELQAAATEEGVLLSLGPQHSFPLEDVFRYLHPDSVRDVLVQALVDAPVFQTRWRWNATLSLALLRWRGGRKVPPQIQRMEAEDLLTAVFPDALACLENVAGDREIPDHPLVRQTLEDCLGHAMDLEGLRDVLRRIRTGEVELVTRDSPEPSPLSHELLTARPYAFLDDAPLEERRAQAVRTRRALDPSAARELGALDPGAIAGVRSEAWPVVEDADQLHDVLLLHGALAEDEPAWGGASGGEDGGPAVDTVAGGSGPTVGTAWGDHLDRLAAAGRAARFRLPAPSGGGEPRGEEARPRPDGPTLWVAAERLPEARLAWPVGRAEPPVEPPEGEAAAPPDRAEAVRELVRGRMELEGPATEARLADRLHLPESDVATALGALEEEGAVLRGHFTPPREAAAGREQGAGRPAGGSPGGEEPPAADDDGPAVEWCERRLLARIHRRTLASLRSRIRPVTAAAYMRFLFRWQRAVPGERVEGPGGLAAVLELLEGAELPAAAWEPDVLALRCRDYDPGELDRLCLAGRVGWGRLSPPAGNGEGLRSTGPLRTSPVSLWLREHADAWLRGAAPGEVAERDSASRGMASGVVDDGDAAHGGLTTEARQVVEALGERGASFFADLVAATGLLPTRVEQALGELVALGWVTSDGFSGLRALLAPSDKRPRPGGEGGGGAGRRRARGKSPYGVDGAGRWSLLRGSGVREGDVTGGEDGGEADGPPGRGASRRRPAYGEPAPGTETAARALLRRYGVVFRRLLDAEAHAPPWRELLLVYRRMEDRGELRGGRFVEGFGGQQFALPEAVGKLRAVRGEEPDGVLRVVSAADPLNLTGILSPGARVPSTPSNRVAYRDGVPVHALESGAVRALTEDDALSGEELRALRTRSVPPQLRAYAG